MKHCVSEASTCPKCLALHPVCNQAEAAQDTLAIVWHVAGVTACLTQLTCARCGHAAGDVYARRPVDRRQELVSQQRGCSKRPGWGHRHLFCHGATLRRALLDRAAALEGSVVALTSHAPLHAIYPRLSTLFMPLREAVF